MSNARDQFADDIYTADRLHKDDPVDLTTHYSYVIADELIAAGYRKPRTITTAEELDALPAGSVVLSDPYRYMVHGGADCGWPVAFQRWDDGMWHRGARSGSTHPDNFLPATVLHEGEATK